MKQFVRYYLRIKSKCMKVTYLFNFIILILLGSCISKELIRQKYDNKIVSIEKADALKYMKPNMPMWLENEEIYNNIHCFS